MDCQRYNKENQKPMFDFIPLNHVVIDTLLLFLEIADVLINLLIRDVRILDGIEKSNGNAKAVKLIRCESFLNSEYNIFLIQFLQ